MSAQEPRKRKRAAVACTTCHNRRVRCNVADKGVPCTNCAQDGTICTIYGRPPAPEFGRNPRQPLRPRESVSNPVVSPYTPTPSTHSTLNAELYQAPNTTTSQDLGDVSSPISEAPSPGAQIRRRAIARAIAATTHDTEPVPGPKHQTTRDHGVNVLVPYYAGEAEGLEFLADICSPNRPVKGTTYIITKNAFKREFWNHRPLESDQHSLPPSVRQRLIQCFFRYIYPTLPVINAGEFLSDYLSSQKKVDDLLLWSVFFAAASYLDADSIRSQGFKSRKSFKEFCYQRAKTLYHSHPPDIDKTTFISATILLAFWYVDLEDTDGCWHWIGVASSLCHGSGFHREPNYDRLTRCPFPPAKLALWRRLWWCVYHRDIWLAFAFGRPVRLHIDDSDLRLPCVDDVLIDLKDIPRELREEYLPLELAALTELWINTLTLSIRLEEVLLTYYRPRKPLLSLQALENTHLEILKLLDKVPSETEHDSPIFILYHTHLNIYYNAVIIALHRSFMLTTPEHLTSRERTDLQQIAVQRCKRSAAATASALNNLITLEMIDLSPSTLITAMMSPMQIHFYEFTHSQGLTRQHAFHNLNLHMIVLTHLKKTYWAADMTHNLFNECLKSLENSKPPGQKQDRNVEDVATSSSESTSRSGHVREPPNTGEIPVLETLGISSNPFEELYYPFNPFDNVHSIFDSTASPAWDMNSTINLDQPPLI